MSLPAQSERTQDVESCDDLEAQCASSVSPGGAFRSFPEKYKQGWRGAVLNFAPSWFTVTMGTGIASILLHNLPYNGNWLRWIAVVIFCANILLYVSFLCISLCRYIMFPGIFMPMIRHPAQSFFVGAVPMGLATLINMVVFVCVPAWGPWAANFAWALWWIDVALSASICVWLPFLMQFNNRDLSNMTAVWLLPIVSTIVAAASGGIVAEVLPNPQHATWTLITSYVLLGSGFPLAMVILVMYFQRLTTCRLPPREVIVSVFLPLGPIGQGSFAILQLGKDCKKIFPMVNTFQFFDGEVIYSMSLVIVLMIWGYGLVWLFFAVASISTSEFPFNMGWWAFTFPIGVYAVATVTLGEELNSRFFRVLGTIFSLTVVLLWMVVTVGTIHGTAKGNLWRAPCVPQYEEKYEKLSHS